MLAYTRPQEFQPQSPRRINYSDPLANGLVCAVYPVGAIYYEAITGQFLTAGADPVLYPQQSLDGNKSAGMWLRGPSASKPVFANPTGLDNVTGAVTIFVDARLTTDGTNRDVFQTWNPITGSGVGIRLDDSASVTNGMQGKINNSVVNFTSTSEILGTNSHLYSHRIAVSFDGTNRRAFAKGRLIQTVADASVPTAHASRRTYMGSDTGSGGGSDGTSLSIALAWNRALSEAEYASIYNNPWRLFEPQRRIIPTAPAAAGAYTLNLETSSYALNGSAATLLLNHALTLSPGSYSLTGFDGTLIKGFYLECSAGNYILSGQDATFALARFLNVEPGSYILNGSDTTLSYSGGYTYSLTLGSGTYAITGNPATFLKASLLTLGPGSYVLTGQDTTLNYSTGTVTLKAGSWIRYRIIT